VQITQLENQQWKRRTERILAIASREIVATKACYHRTCYKGYTRTEASHNGASDGCGESLGNEYSHLVLEANRQMLFDCIRSDVLENEKIIRLHEMTSHLTCLGVEDI